MCISYKKNVSKRDHLQFVKMSKIVKKVMGDAGVRSEMGRKCPVKGPR